MTCGSHSRSHLLLNAQDRLMLAKLKNELMAKFSEKEGATSPETGNTEKPKKILICQDKRCRTKTFFRKVNFKVACITLLSHVAFELVVGKWTHIKWRDPGDRSRKDVSLNRRFFHCSRRGCTEPRSSGMCSGGARGLCRLEVGGDGRGRSAGRGNGNGCLS